MNLSCRRALLCGSPVSIVRAASDTQSTPIPTRLIFSQEPADPPPLHVPRSLQLIEPAAQSAVAHACGSRRRTSEPVSAMVPLREHGHGFCMLGSHPAAARGTDETVAGAGLGAFKGGGAVGQACRLDAIARDCLVSLLSRSLCAPLKHLRPPSTPPSTSWR